jgi:predicted metal-dependent hydrolase
MKLFVEGIEVELIRKKIKNMHLYVLRPDGKVRLSAPLRLSEDKIIMFIKSRLDWIKQQQQIIYSEPHDKPITYSSGEIIKIFGVPYTLDVIESNKSAFYFFAGIAKLYCRKNSTTEQKEAIVDKALREALYEKTKPLVEKWESITGLKSSSYQIKKMKTRWGTCNTITKKIWLNFELVRKSDTCIEYVILHELAHLKAPNHGNDFIAIMNRYMPSWKEIREILNKT